MKSSGHVLVVDGDHLPRVRLRRLLEDAGFEVSTATDGQMAIGLLESLERTPTLILVNPVMRLIDGDEFIRRVKAHPTWSAIPIALLASGPDDRAGAARLPRDASDEEILGTVRRLSR